MGRMKDLVVDVIEMFYDNVPVDAIAYEVGLTENQVVRILDENCPEFIEVI
jgi:hypothetical protein